MSRLGHEAVKMLRALPLKSAAPIYSSFYRCRMSSMPSAWITELGWGAHSRLLELFGGHLLQAWLGSALIFARRAPGSAAYRTTNFLDPL